jgi:hippurate hydrolase
MLILGKGTPRSTEILTNFAEIFLCAASRYLLQTYGIKHNLSQCGLYCRSLSQEHEIRIALPPIIAKDVGMKTIDLITLRRDFHRAPELGFAENLTKARIAAILTELGLEVFEGVGVVGLLKQGSGNRAIGLRADMDALPIFETSTHDYVSQNPGAMHACGHDGHMTMLLGAAAILAKDPDFDGTVVFLFQPNEEHGLGAQAMLDEGILERFPIQEVYAIHNLPGAPLGQVSTRTGQICSSESLFEIIIEGKGGHASMPQMGRDAITIGAEIVQALQTIVSRKLAPGAGVVVSVTEFITNGQRNVLPGRATLKGDVRARMPQDREAVAKLMKQISEGIAAAHGVSISVAFNTEFIETINASGPTEAVVEAAGAQGLETIPNREPMSFSEDFAHFCQAVPGCLLLIGNGQEGPYGQPLHASNYDFNDALLPIGAAFWAQLVRDRLAKPAGEQGDNV